MEFKYAPMFQLGEDKTEYYKIPGSEKLVSTAEFEGKKILKVTPEALTLMTNTAFRDVSFLLRRSHNEQVAKILSDPEASANDKYVALTFLRNAEVASKGKLPLCQDTGTAIVHGEKGQQVWTGFEDEEAISLGVYKTYTEENLRYSQNAPLDMYNEVNTKCNLPAQIDIEATHGDESLSGDQGPHSEPRHAHPVPRIQDEKPRNGRMSSVPHRLRDWRHFCGEESSHS